MPELPELEVIKNFLNNHILGKPIEQVRILEPLVFRCSLETFTKELQENHFIQVRRSGKFLLFSLMSRSVMVIHLMLAGRLQLCSSDAKLPSRTCLRLSFSDGQELRYFDEQLMGKIYLVPEGDFAKVPQWSELGPEPLSDEFTYPVFLHRLKKHRGMVKNVLVNQNFLAGIGNAYADEILFAANILPFRKISELSPSELERLYQSIRFVLEQAIEHLSARVMGNIQNEIRDFLKVHGKGGEPCPVCGHPISEITANRKITHFCRHCQQ